MAAERRFLITNDPRLRDLLVPRGYVAGTVRADWAESVALGARDVVLVHSSTVDDLSVRLQQRPPGHLLMIRDLRSADAEPTAMATVPTLLCVRDETGESAFPDALGHVLEQPCIGVRPEFLPLREVVERINQYFRARHLAQHVTLHPADHTGPDPFFPNSQHIPDLPAGGVDVAALDRLRRRHRGHFEPRARGLEHLGEIGDHFVGRTAVLAELGRWLVGRHDRRARVVTGDPGSGKSAVLGRLLLPPDAAHPAGAGAGPRPLVPPGMRLVPLHAQRAALEDLTASLATVVRAPGSGRDALPALLETLGQGTTPVTVVVDALDEAGTAGDSGEGLRIARELLQPLTALPGVRLIVGARRPLLTALGRATTVLDLDRQDFFTRDDVLGYARSLLLDADEPDSFSPYHDRPDLAETVAQGIAERAGTCFLVARMTARALVQGQITVDPTRPGWERELPSDVGQAFAGYLARFGPRQDEVIRLLRPLAYAQGSGLPWSTVWGPVVKALSGKPCSSEDLEWLHRNAGEYVVDTEAAGGSGYRLYHETLAEHLRTPGSEAAAHRAIADALLAEVRPDRPGGGQAWARAHPYIRDHLADHAAAGGTLEQLLDDNDYLVYAGPASLMRALRTAPPTVGGDAGPVYRASAGIHASLSPSERRDILAIDAARFNRHGDTIREFADGRPWRPLWATGSLVHSALRTTLTGRQGHAMGISCVRIDGRPHALAIDSQDRGPDTSLFFPDGVIRLWDLTSGSEVGTLTGHRGKINAVAGYEFQGRAYAVTVSPADYLRNGAGDGSVRLWDLTEGTGQVVASDDLGQMSSVACAVVDGQPHAVTGNQTGEAAVRVWNLATHELRRRLSDHTGAVTSLDCADIDGRPHAVVGCQGGGTWVYDLVDCTLRAVLTGDSRWVHAVSCVTLDGRPHVVTHGTDQEARVLRLDDGSLRTTLIGTTSRLSALACTDIGGRPHAVSGGRDGKVRLWDLESGRERAAFTGHASGVNAVTCIGIDGRAHAVTGSGEPAARVWDLTEDSRTNTIRRGHSAQVSGAACTTIDGRPHAVTIGRDDVLRVWDADSGAPRAQLTGHSDGAGGHPPSLDCVMIGGRPYAVTGGADHTVRVWDLTGARQRSVRTGHRNQVLALTCTTLQRQPKAVTTGSDWTVHVWDVADESRPERVLRCGRPSRHEYDPGRSACAVVCTELDARPHVAVAWGGHDPEVHLMDLTDGETCEVLHCTTGGVSVLALAHIMNQPHVVACGDGVEVWNLADRTRRAVLPGHTARVYAAACADLDGRPFAFTTGADRTVRVWDLLSNEAAGRITLPLRGHAITATPTRILVGIDDDIVMFTRQDGR
ncbi:hypothetical protein [Streptomyces pseudovenezuelae]|uniref:hypothetical protein n=1 Tax=Streptomyces pseudovenezuelae TaxID=67350 RepID=UPI0037202760